MFRFFFSVVSLHLHVAVFQTHFAAFLLLSLFLKTRQNTTPAPFIIYDGLEKHFIVNYTSASLQQCSAAAPPSRIFGGFIYPYIFPQRCRLRREAHANANAVVTSVFAAVPLQPAPLIFFFLILCLL